MYDDNDETLQQNKVATCEISNQNIFIYKNYDSADVLSHRKNVRNKRQQKPSSHRAIVASKQHRHQRLRRQEHQRAAFVFDGITISFDDNNDLELTAEARPSSNRQRTAPTRCRYSSSTPLMSIRSRIGFVRLTRAERRRAERSI